VEENKRHNEGWLYDYLVRTHWDNEHLGWARLYFLLSLDSLSHVIGTDNNRFGYRFCQMVTLAHIDIQDETIRRDRAAQ